MVPSAASPSTRPVRATTRASDRAVQADVRWAPDDPRRRWLAALLPVGVLVGLWVALLHAGCGPAPRWVRPAERLLRALIWGAVLGDFVLFWLWLLNNVAIAHQLALWRAGVGP